MNWYNQKLAKINPLEKYTRSISGLIMKKFKDGERFFSIKNNEHGISGIRDITVIIYYRDWSSVKVQAANYETKEGEQDIGIDIHISKDFDQKIYSTLYLKLSSAIRHELEHCFQESSRKFKDYPFNWNKRIEEQGLEVAKQYLMHPVEIEATVAGLYFSAKKSKKPFLSVLNMWLNKVRNFYIQNGFNEKKVNQLVSIVGREYVNYAEKRFPAAQMRVAQYVVKSK